MHVHHLLPQNADRLLRSRTAASDTISSALSPSVPLLAPHPLVEQQTQTRNWRQRLSRTLLLISTLYATLLVLWSADRLKLINSGDVSLASGNAGLSAPGDWSREPGSRLGVDEDKDVSSDELLWGHILEDKPLLSDLALETRPTLPPSSRDTHIKAMREAREKMRIQQLLPHMHHALLVSEIEAKKREAESHARSVKILPADDTSQRQFRCVGWRATGDCSPDGPREPEHDEPCTKLIQVGEAGYCEIEDIHSGERFRALRRHCNSLKPGALFRCFEATSLVKFSQEAMDAVESAQVEGQVTIERHQMDKRDGIVMVIYPRLLASAYATVHTLRDVLGCHLPLEIWFRPIEFQNTPAALQILHRLVAGDFSGGITLHKIDNPWATGFNAKIFAIHNSSFERVLFLDADNVPVRDPTFLFESPEFVETGAVFWPDFWHPGHTIFNIHNQSLVWEVLGTPFVDMFEQESGQVLIDRRRHAAALELVHFYAFHQPNHFKRLNVAYGDKDLFRFAWLKLGANFHMIQAPPAVAGKVTSDSFCGMTMVQHDAHGEVLFLHRNSHKLTGEAKRAYVNVRESAKQRAAEKLRQQDPDGRIYPTGKEIDAEIDTGTPAPTLWAPEPDGYPDAAIWTHLLSFRNTSDRAQYVIKGFHASPEFPKWQNCYGQRYIGSNPNFYAQEVASTNFAGLETHLRRFAAEAAQLLSGAYDDGSFTP